MLNNQLKVECLLHLANPNISEKSKNLTKCHWWEFRGFVFSLRFQNFNWAQRNTFYSENRWGVKAHKFDRCFGWVLPQLVGSRGGHGMPPWKHEYDAIYFSCNLLSYVNIAILSIKRLLKIVSPRSIFKNMGQQDQEWENLHFT